jgi:hypothetical protein
MKRHYDPTPATTVAPHLWERPSGSAGWSLQQNASLTSSNWLPSGYDGYGITDDGTNKSLVISAARGNAFFRLLHP